MSHVEHATLPGKYAYEPMSHPTHWFPCDMVPAPQVSHEKDAASDTVPASQYAHDHVVGSKYELLSQGTQSLIELLPG